jgi:hypothetical protein
MAGGPLAPVFVAFLRRAHASHLWLEPGRGYGFPVPNNIRDLLVGDDKKFF